MLEIVYFFLLRTGIDGKFYFERCGHYEFHDKKRQLPLGSKVF